MSGLCGTRCLGYPSTAAAIRSLAAAGVPERLIRDLVETEVGVVAAYRWNEALARGAGSPPALPLTPEAERRLAIHGWPARARTIRRRACLVCGAAFLSQGSHHRCCDRCRARNAAAAPGFEGLGW